MLFIHKYIKEEYYIYTKYYSKTMHITSNMIYKFNVNLIYHNKSTSSISEKLIYIYIKLYANIIIYIFLHRSSVRLQ